MIFIKFKKGQGLGNQLWNYVTLRSIAKYKSFDFCILDFENFKGIEFLDIAKSSKIFNQSFLKNINLNYFYETIYYDKNLKNYSCDYDKSILEIADQTILKGIFQSEKYLYPNKLIINDFIKVKPQKSIIDFDLDNLCLLNIRGGEYKRHKDLILPKSYWLNAIDNMRKFNPNLNYKIVTDDYRYSKALFPELEIIKGDIASDFSLLKEAKYLIISNSSFSYFPIRLGASPKLIIAPLFWSRFNNQYNRWSSPANCYENFSWQNHEGKIISKNQLDFTLINTRKEYEKFNIKCSKDSIHSKGFNINIPTKVKKLIKYFLSILFPLKYG
tara:strand:+ start:1463 stop:2446 length:984 start_codon:yes stop_codon:yes gene_type:complete